jgi:hypothetical protein
MPHACLSLQLIEDPTRCDARVQLGGFGDFGAPIAGCHALAPALHSVLVLPRLRSFHQYVSNTRFQSVDLFIIKLLVGDEHRLISPFSTPKVLNWREHLMSKAAPSLYLFSLFFFSFDLMKRHAKRRSS